MLGSAKVVSGVGEQMMGRKAKMAVWDLRSQKACGEKSLKEEEEENRIAGIEKLAM